MLPLLILTVCSWGIIGFSPQDPARFALNLAFAPPSAKHWLGCAAGGVDLLAYAAHSMGYVMALAAGVSGVSLLVGTLAGTTATLLGARYARWMLRACDLVQAFPGFLLALTVLTAVQMPNRWHIGLVLSLTTWAGFARLAVVMSRQVMAADFVMAARSCGASVGHVVLRHAIPHISGPLLVQMGTVAAGVVLSESALSFVGLGPSDGVSLGVLIEQGALAMLRAPRVLLVAVGAIMLTSGGFQLAAEGLRKFWQVRSAS